MLVGMTVGCYALIRAIVSDCAVRSDMIEVMSDCFAIYPGIIE